jgi:hypothetical protein
MFLPLKLGELNLYLRFLGGPLIDFGLSCYLMHVHEFFTFELWLIKPPIKVYWWSLYFILV